MRTIKRQCGACSGAGGERVHEYDWISDHEWNPWVPCPACGGAGFTVITAPDKIRCVCGQGFDSIEALAAHRKEHT